MKSKKQLIKRAAVKEMYDVLHAYLGDDEIKRIHGEFDAIISMYG